MDGLAGPRRRRAPIEHRYISGGSQNEIYEIRRGDLHGAIRIPPPTAAPDRDEGILREWRIIEALDGTDVPHTEAIAVCDDTSVLGRPFYLMGFVDGWSPMGTHGSWPEPFDTDLEARRGLAFELVEGIAQLSKVDWQAKGLGGSRPPRRLPRAPGRPVDRASSTASRAASSRASTRPRPGCARHAPLDFVPGLMHGDYQFANVMYRHGAPGRARRHRRLGDGHRRRPQARPGLGRAGLARGHERRRRHRR